MLTRRSVRLFGTVASFVWTAMAVGVFPVLEGLHVSPALAQDADWPKVVEAAKKEGKVVVYNGAVGNPVLPKIAAAFEAKYGIRMELLEARASEIRERIRTEQASGKVLGDVLHDGSTTTALQLAEGRLQPHGVFLDFLLTDEAQLMYGRVGYGTVVGGLERRIPPEARAIAQPKLLGTTDPKQQEEMMKVARQIYK